MSSIKLTFPSNISDPCKVRITAKNAQALEAADRLASRAIHEVCPSPIVTFMVNS